MQIKSAFPGGDRLKPEHLQGRKVRVEIDYVEVRQVGRDEEKPCLYFIGKPKHLVLNRTNAETLEDAFGGETDDWHQREIVLYVTKVDYAGKKVDGIRIEIPRRTPRADHQAPLDYPQEAPAGAGPSPSPDAGARVDDEIPF